MSRISDQELARNEAAIRAAMDRLLAGHIPAGGRCDLRTLAVEAGVNRTGFYAKGARPGPYQYLAEEFTRRLTALHHAHQITDQRDAQIARLKQDNQRLRDRLSTQDKELKELLTLKTLAISRLAAQHEQIRRLAQDRRSVRLLPAIGQGER